jgi:hypothetical protein
LVTGAGVSGRGTNRVGKPIVGADALAKLIAEAADLPYSEEELKEVFDAAEESLGSAKLKKIFEDNFTQTTPSDPLVRLFGTPWRRAYTFNVDDTIERIPTKRTAQKLRFFNALRDRREEKSGEATTSAKLFTCMASQVKQRQDTSSRRINTLMLQQRILLGIRSLVRILLTTRLCLLAQR